MDPRVWEIARVAAKWVPVLGVIKMPRTRGSAGRTPLRALNVTRGVLGRVYFATTERAVEPKQFKMEEKASSAYVSQ